MTAQKKELTQYSPEIREYMRKHGLHAYGGILSNKTPLQEPLQPLNVEPLIGDTLNEEIQQPNTYKQWGDLSLKERAEMMRVAIRNGITNLSDIRDKYNEFALGGNIYAGGSVLKKMKEGLSNTTARVENQVVQNKLADKNFYEALPLLFAMDGVSIKVTSGYRPNSRVQESGKNTGRRSRHSYWGGAADIVAMGKSSFADIRKVLDNPNSNTSRWLRANGYGYLDETSATGTTKYWHDHTRDHSHYHIGMDYGKRYASMFRGSAQPTNSKWERRAEAYWAKAEPMYRELLNAGIDPVAAAGILGNIAQESGFNPNAANSVAGGHWGYLQNDRNITPWVRANYGGYDHKHQMDYLIAGLQGRLPEKNMGLDKRFNGFNTRMKGVTDPEMAAYLWEREYERSANENIPERKYFARYFYDRMMGNTPTSLTQNTPYQTNPFMGYQVSNPRAFYGNPGDYQQDYAKLFSQQEVSQPLVDAAFKYSEEEQRKAERQQQMANFRTLLGMTGAFGDDGLLGGVPLLTGGLFGNMGAYGGRLYGDGGVRGRYWIEDEKVLPEMVVTPKGNDYMTDEIGNPAVSLGALRDIDPNIKVYSHKELKDNQYRTMPTNSEANAFADAWTEQTAPTVGHLISAGLKPLDLITPSRYVGLLDSDNKNGFLHLFDEDNRGLFINDNPNGMFSKRYADEHPYWAMAGNMAFDIPASMAAGWAIEKGWNTAAPYVENAYNTGKTIANKGIGLISNWRPWVPKDANSYYRIVDGRTISDAANRGVMISSSKAYELNPEFRRFVDNNPGTKLYDYLMFSKGRPWEGSTARTTGGKPYIIKSTGEPNGVVWQQSNVDGFSHHGHDGIFRPSYFGDLEGIPTQGFEYWKPNWLGYSRKQFPITKDPY